jgi:hypothetical protein
MELIKSHAETILLGALCLLILAKVWKIAEVLSLIQLSIGASVHCDRRL